MPDQKPPVWKHWWNNVRRAFRLWSRRTGHQPAESRISAAGRPSRRALLRTLGLCPLAGLLPSSGAGRPEGEESSSTWPTALVIGEADAREHHRLKHLDLADAEVLARRQKMPVGKIGGLSVGRLISGSNLISMNMHARDLDYVRALAGRYNTEERIFMTLKKCEEQGVNTIVLKNHNFRQFKLSRYWDEWGGKMQWMADVITTDIEQYERLLVEHLELGAAAAYLWGGASDIWHYHKQQKNIVRAFDIMRRYKIPAGIGAHRLEPIAFCEKEGLKPDFYLKTLHHDRYWSAHPRENRRYMEMYEKESEDHADYHDNMFCHDPEETVAFMQEVKVPWIAFKVLAAGAIPPREGIRYAFESGADFICLGMFDFQVEQDAELIQRAVAKLQSRTRPWA